MALLKLLAGTICLAAIANGLAVTHSTRDNELVSPTVTSDTRSTVVSDFQGEWINSWGCDMRRPLSVNSGLERRESQSTTMKKKTHHRLVMC
jgi:hypothetical protein